MCKTQNSKKLMVAVFSIILSAVIILSVWLAISSGILQDPNESGGGGSRPISRIDNNYLNELASEGKVGVAYAEDNSVKMINGTFIDASVTSAEDALNVLEQLTPILGDDFVPTASDISHQTAGEGTENTEHFYKYSPKVNGVKVLGDQVVISTAENGMVTGLYSTYNSDISSIDTTAIIEEETAISSAWDALLENENVVAFINDYFSEIDDYNEIINEFKAGLEVSVDLMIYASDDDLPPALVYAVTIANKAGELESLGEESAVEPDADVVYIDSVDAGERANTASAILDVTFYVYANGEHAGEIYLANDNGQGWESVRISSKDGLGNKREFIAQKEKGKYRLRDSTRNIETYKTTYGNILWIEPKLPGKLVKFSGTDKIDATAVSVHANMSVVYDYYCKVLGRKSFDGKGAKVVSSYDFDNCNFIFTGDYHNASWKSQEQQFVFGDAGNFGNALDVVAHEFTHAVINYIVGDGKELTLTYLNESGALNESYADIMGCLIENKSGKGFWEMGEDSDGSLRSLAWPGMYGQPSQYSNRYVGDEDKGGVHTNSGIFNHAAYLMMTDSRTSGISRETWAKVFYNSLFRLSCDSKFVDGRNAIVASATAMKFTDKQLAAIRDAFDMVGVCNFLEQFKKPSAPTETEPSKQPSEPDNSQPSSIPETTPPTETPTQPPVVQKPAVMTADDIDVHLEALTWLGLFDSIHSISDADLYFTILMEVKGYEQVPVGGDNEWNTIYRYSYPISVLDNWTKQVFGTTFDFSHVKNSGFEDVDVTYDTANDTLVFTEQYYWRGAGGYPTYEYVSHSMDGNHYIVQCSRSIEGEKSNVQLTFYESDYGFALVSAQAVPSAPNEDIPSHLKFELTSDGTSYIVSGVISKQITSVVIPSVYSGLPVTGIGKYAFTECYNLTSVVIENGITLIDSNAFDQCTGLTSITLPDSITTIANYAFNKCSALNNVSVGSGTTSIGHKAFYWCTALQRIGIDANNPQYSSDERGVLFDKNKSTLLLAPQAIEGGYAIPNGVIEIGAGAFWHCSKITSLTIPDGVVSIGMDALRDCKALTSVSIPASLTTIGDYAFRYSPVLGTIKYRGTMEQWASIAKGANWHENVPATEVICSDGTVSIS